MTLGAKESNSKEAMGIALIVGGLTCWVAGWAYGESIMQIIFVIIGVAGFMGGFGVLHSAKKM